MRDSIELAIAGCGRISELGHVPALRRVPELRLRALADPSAERREALRAAAGDGEVRCFDSVAEMLAAARPRAVVVASPPELHLEHAELAAAAGAAVLVEKPPGRGRGEAERLAAKGGRIWVGFNRRFSHLSAVADVIPRSGRLDVALEIRYRRRSWRPHQVRDDALDDLGPHVVDLARCLLGDDLGVDRRPTVSPSWAEVVLAGPGGTASLRCATDAPWRERVEVRNGHGRLVARSLHGGRARGVAARLASREHPLVASLAGELRAFAAAARGGDGGRLATAGDGAAAMALVEEVREAAEREAVAA